MLANKHPKRGTPQIWAQVLSQGAGNETQPQHKRGQQDEIREGGDVALDHLSTQPTGVVRLREGLGEVVQQRKRQANPPIATPDHKTPSSTD